MHSSSNHHSLHSIRPGAQVPPSMWHTLLTDTPLSARGGPRTLWSPLRPPPQPQLCHSEHNAASLLLLAGARQLLGELGQVLLQTGQAGHPCSAQPHLLLNRPCLKAHHTGHSCTPERCPALVGKLCKRHGARAGCQQYQLPPPVSNMEVQASQGNKSKSAPGGARCAPPACDAASQRHRGSCATAT